MRLTFAALAVAAGLVGFSASVQAAPVAPSGPLAAAVDNGVERAQMSPERRMMRRRMMRREMRRDRRTMRRMMRHDRRMMRRMRRM